jgi:hypothetical protein
MTYQYSVLRFVPDPARGEFVNLAVIAGDDDLGDWELRGVSRYRRAKAIDEDDRLGAALDFVARLDDRISTQSLWPEGGPLVTDELNRWSVEMQNIVQVTQPTPVVAQSAAEAVELLYERLIVDPEAREYGEKKFRAVQSTREAYREHEVPDTAIARWASVRVGPYNAPFDFAVHNGQAVQLVQCWSFQQTGQAELAEQVKSWAWVVHELRKVNGSVLGRGEAEARPVDSGVEVASVYIPPRSEDSSEAYDEAMAAFEEVNVLAVPVSEAGELGSRAAAYLGGGVAA